MIIDVKADNMESKKEWSRPDQQIIAFYVAQEAAVEKRNEVGQALEIKFMRSFAVKFSSGLFWNF